MSDPMPTDQSVPQARCSAIQRWALEDDKRRAEWRVENAEKLVAEAVASFGGELPKPIAEARTILIARRAALRSCKAQLEDYNV